MSSELHLLDSDPLLQLHELNSAQGLGEHVRKLIFSAHILDVNLASLNTVTDEMIPQVNMLVAIVMHRILAQAIADLCPPAA